MVFLEVFAISTIGAVVVMELYLLKKLFTDRNYPHIYRPHPTSRGGATNENTVHQQNPGY